MNTQDIKTILNNLQNFKHEEAKVLQRYRQANKHITDAYNDFVHKVKEAYFQAYMDGLVPTPWEDEDGDWRPSLTLTPKVNYFKISKVKDINFKDETITLSFELHKAREYEEIYMDYTFPLSMVTDYPSFKTQITEEEMAIRHEEEKITKDKELKELERLQAKYPKE